MQMSQYKGEILSHNYNYKEEMGPAPRPAVRRRKRRERDFRRIRNEERREIRNEERRERRQDVNEENEGFDWLAGGDASGANRESEVRKTSFFSPKFLA